MLGIVKDSKIIPLTTDAGTGAPVGTLIQQYKKKPMSGYLYCDGSTFDENAYPALYMYLGTNVLPDYRECVMVGAEQNTTDTIAAHDVYTEGEFKDDQMQPYFSGGSLPTYIGGEVTVQNLAGGDFGFYVGNQRRELLKTRTGTTTHGKQKAVYVYIKATSGLAENQQDNVLNDVKNYVDNSNSYSTQEVKTGGTWIDGKPIYRNVLITKSLLNGDTIGWAGLESDVASLNIDNCIGCRGIPNTAIKDGMRYIQFMPSQGGFCSFKSGLNPGSKIIIEYTKTTD